VQIVAPPQAAGVTGSNNHDGGLLYNQDELMADRDSHYRFRQAGPGPADARPTRKPASKLWLLRRQLTTTKGLAAIGRKTRRLFRQLLGGKA